MADPYVNLAPAEVGPCTATWFIGPDSGSASNDNPTFGPAGGPFLNAAWTHLVTGPLKDVLMAEYENADEFLSAWAAAGGQVDFTVQTAEGSPVYSGTAYGEKSLATSNGQWHLIYSPMIDAGAALPLRWVVKFSVPHSIIR